jgi:hypothetical protein
MKRLLILLILFWSCSPKQQEKQAGEVKKSNTNLTADSVYVSHEIISDTNIVNSSGHKIVALYNSINNFLSKTDTVGVHFSTECMMCEAVVPYRNHLIFANQLNLSPEKAVFNKAELSLLDSIESIKRVGSYGSFSTVNFTFSNGTGVIKHVGQSCNDAYFKEVTLKYKQGYIKIKNALNAEFFEYDLDNNGKLEQFILAMRNCSQELAVLQIL